MAHSLVLVFVSSLLCLGGFGCRESKSPDHKDEGIFVLPRIDVPDTLGGRRLKGFVTLAIDVHKSGRIGTYRIKMIWAGFDSASAVLYPPREEHATAEQKASADSLLATMSPWIDRCFRQLKLGADFDRVRFGQNDSLPFLYVLRLNEN